MQTIRENIATIVAGVVVAAIVAVALALFGPWRNSGSGGLVAVVHDANDREHRLPLNQDTTLEISTDAGRNVIVVEKGAARMVEADCPNGSCMQQLPISQPGQQIICLPHRLWVEVVAEGNETSELNEDAVTWSEQDNESDKPVDLVAR